MMDRRSLLGAMAAAVTFPVDAVKKLLSPSTHKVTNIPYENPFSLPIFTPHELTVARTLSEKSCMGFIHACEILAVMHDPAWRGLTPDRYVPFGYCDHRIREIKKQNPELHSYVTAEMESILQGGTIKLWKSVGSTFKTAESFSDQVKLMINKRHNPEHGVDFNLNQQVYRQGEYYLGGAVKFTIRETSKIREDGFFTMNVVHFYIDSPVERQNAVKQLHKLAHRYPAMKTSADMLTKSWADWNIHRPFPTERRAS